MKMKNLVLSVAIVILILGKVKAQDFTNYNLYLQNPVLYNPAQTLDDSKIRGFINTHQQWTGFKGAPKGNTFGVYGTFIENMGFGLTAYKKSQGITSNTNLSLSYAYRTFLGDKHFLTFGVDAGVLMDELRTDEISKWTEQSDVTIAANTYNQTSFSAKAGVVYYYRSFEAQLVFPQLFQRNKTNGYTIAMCSYEYTLNSFWDIKPGLMYRNAKTTPSQLDANVMLTYKKMVSGQVGYRTDKSYVFAIGVNYKSFSLGYAWQQESDFIASATKGTNEVQLIYRFGKNTKEVVRDNSLIHDEAQLLDPAKLEEQKKLEDAKKLADQQRIEDQKKLNEETLIEQTKIEQKMNAVLQKFEDLNKVIMQKEISNGTPIEIKVGETFSLGYITFETGTATLTKDAFALLDKLSDALKQNPAVNVEISGHTDNTGSEATNEVLSNNRAKSCLAYLESRGLAAQRLKAVGKGSTQPKVPNTTWENKGKNRRVEFKFVQ